MTEIASRIIDEEEAARYRAEFPIFDHTTYLNSCSLGPLSRRGMQALQEFQESWSDYGAPAWVPIWLPQLQAAKERFARLIGAGVHEVTISHSISSALASIASALDYRERSDVLCANLDFPTIPYQWLAKQQHGVNVRFARSEDSITVPYHAYQALIDDRVAAIATSHVFYATGAVQPIRQLADLAHAHGSKLIVDGYHSVGVFPVNVKELDVDVYVGGVLKWLLGGQGLTFIYIREELLAELHPTITGWFAAADQFAFDSTRFDPAANADKFELGTPAVPTAYTGVAGMDMILEAEPARIYERIQRLTDQLIGRAQEERYGINSPLDRNARGGVVMLRVENPRETVADLAEGHFAIDYRPGLIRISPHFYNTTDDINRFMDALRTVQRART